MITSPSRRQFLHTLGAGALALGATPAVLRAAEKPMSRRLNVLLLLADDQRFSTIGALGYPEVQTPNLDALVRRGTSFTHACIMGGTSGAVCIASRAMLLSGRTLFHLEGQGQRIPAAHITLPEFLRGQGYATFITGKWHQDRPSLHRSFGAATKVFFGGMSTHLDVPVQDYDPTGKYPAGRATKAETFSSELFADAAIKFLRDQPKDQPFCVHVPFTAPHDPRTPPKAYRDKYDPTRLPLPPNFLPEHPFDNGELRVRDEMLAPHPRTPEAVRTHLADYYGMITHLDAQIGRVLKVLEETGHAEDTLVVFAGDNGLALGQHGLFGKQSVYEHSVRVPLIFAGPGIPQDRRTDALAYLLDVYPTLCAALGLTPPASVEGKNLLPVIRGEAAGGRASLFFAYRHLHRAVRTRQHKLIEYYVKDQRHTQLFDLAADPWETKDLSADPARAALLADLRKELARWQRELEDPMLATK